MKISTLVICSLLVTGCGVSVSTSGMRLGIIDDVTIVENGSRVTTEEVVGIKIDWAPRFTWRDVVKWFNEE